MHNRNRCLHKQFVAEKYDIQCTPTKLVLYNWMNPKANHLRDFDMTTIQLNKSKKLKGRCLFKRLQTMLKQQFNEFILPVLTEHNTKSNKLKDNTETINSQTIESFNEIPHSKQSLNNQSEKISLKFNSSKLCNSNDISDYDRRSQYDYGENFLKQFEEKYTFNDTSNSTESIIYVYCSTCSHIFPCKNLDELKQLNLFESDTFSSTYDFSSENEDIDEEFQLEESHPFYMDYLNPSYEWIRTSRPYSAPPVLISTTYK
ncbi:hypothetical protein MN116_003701 [Schistosoma mekongi]|uniref:Uncharacterized protein n=1 Tax=Schistosoma mekongi TaxID=38744 RepID=A0AAE2D714_SCHME|nr:hypothetical protein MN116_003701 [Schistosoma mekongi]